MPVPPTDTPTSAAPVDGAPALSTLSRDNASLYSADTKCEPKSATVVVDATDADGIAGITLHWHFDHVVHTVAVRDEGSGEMVLQSPGHYSAGLGPFTGDGTATYWVTARDAFGQESTTDNQAVSVTATCIL